MSAPVSKNIGSTVVPLKTGTGGKIVGIYAFSTAVVYLQLFDAPNAAAITPGTTAPTLSLGIGANQPLFIGPGDVGWDFSQGIFAVASASRAGVGAGSIDANFAIDIP
jgi:hypothetical protein